MGRPKTASPGRATPDGRKIPLGYRIGARLATSDIEPVSAFGRRMMAAQLTSMVANLDPAKAAAIVETTFKIARKDIAALVAARRHAAASETKR